MADLDRRKGLRDFIQKGYSPIKDLSDRLKRGDNLNDSLKGVIKECLRWESKEEIYQSHLENFIPIIISRLEKVDDRINYITKLKDGKLEAIGVYYLMQRFFGDDNKWIISAQELVDDRLLGIPSWYRGNYTYSLSDNSILGKIENQDKDSKNVVVTHVVAFNYKLSNCELIIKNYGEFNLNKEKLNLLSKAFGDREEVIIDNMRIYSWNDVEGTDLYKHFLLE